jgi:hypothetical protein
MARRAGVVMFLTEIPADVHYQAKIQAAVDGITLKAFVLRALAQAVAACRPATPDGRAQVPRPATRAETAPTPEHASA